MKKLSYPETIEKLASCTNFIFEYENSTEKNKIQK